MPGNDERMARILVTEEIAEGGLDRLRAAGHEVVVQLDLSQLLTAVRGAHALIIRSATQVTAEVLEAGSELLVVGRAGIGRAYTTGRGRIVVRARAEIEPQSNIISAAEHTMALLLAQARNVPQAHAALIAGRWERTRWEGVELADKTLAVVGLGRIGKLVADRAKAFGMRLVAYDPFVSADRARQMGVELMSLDQAVAEADFLTIHLPKTKETTGLINRDLLLKAKPSLRVINVARGGIVDEQALADCVRDGIIAGAAIDVFVTEPTTVSPLFEQPSIVVTPHLGASTREAQDKAGDTIASLVGALPDSLEVCTEGDIAGYDTRIISLAALKGFFGTITDEQVTYVNAPQLAKEKGVELRETNCATSADFVNLVTLRGAGHSLSGTLVGRRSEQRIVMIDDHHFDVPPAEHMLVVKNDDRPGVIGTVGTLLGDAGVNIADMDVGRAATPGTAVMLIAPTMEVPADVIARLRTAPGIISVTPLAG